MSGYCDERSVFPEETPLSDMVDFAFPANQFELSGGNIRDAALEAAFLAARDGKVIHMEHLVQAMGLLMVKQGRLLSPMDFGEYYERLTY